MADVNTGSAGLLRMEAWVNWADAGQNAASYHWKLSLIERFAQGYGWSGGTPASVEIFWDGGAGYHSPWSGNFAWDFRGGGQQSVVIAEGDIVLGNYGNGDARGFTFRGNMGNSGTSTVGGPVSVDQGVNAGNLYVLPGTPSTPSVTRVSDTQINLSWTQSSAGNGQPTNNDLSRSVNGGAWEDNFVVIAATNGVSVGAAANQKIQYRVRAWKSGAGHSGWSGASSPIYTTPGAPSSASAVKNASQDIVVSFVPTVAYSEHTHEVWHGTVTGGVTTWDGSPLATLASGVTSYTHAAPNASQVHVYRVRAVAGSLQSAYATTSSVQLLTAPGKPSVPAMGQYFNKAAALTFEWTHNTIDSTPQSAYEFSVSTNGGSSWTSSGKITSTAQQRTIAASTYAGNVNLTTRVRTWGQATTGGSDGTGASPWSDLRTVTFKTIPTTSVTAPANGSNYTDATVRADIGFGQVEGATFVQAELQLLQGATLLEELTSNNRVGITFGTKVNNATSYTVRARVRDSNGLWSNWATSTFNVVYLSPPIATGGAIYLEQKGYVQLNLFVGAPGGGQSAAATISITRTIDGVTETVVENYPSASQLTFLDTTPTIHGLNEYRIVTKTALGAEAVRLINLETNELRRAFLSKGPSFDDVIVFGGNLEVGEGLGVASTTVQAAGRTKPIGLYGVETEVQVKVKSFIFENFGSTIDEIRKLLLRPGKACYRDASGRRVFGSVRGSVDYKKVGRGNLSFTMTETS